ncbi:F-box domain protein, partial [Ostertagia ostertagi]
KYFPWCRLPQELQVKVLQNLRRSDVDKFQLLNRETFELVGRNQRLLKRRHIERMLIRVDTNLSRFEAVCRRRSKKDWVSFFSLDDLPKALRNSDIQSLEIVKVAARDLPLILSYFLDAGSRVQELTIKDAPFLIADSPSSILRFLLDVAPEDICFLKISCWDGLGPEVFQVIVSRERFCVSSWGNARVIPIDDNILAELTATSFFIGAPNNITIDGLLSFVE